MASDMRASIRRFRIARTSTSKVAGKEPGRPKHPSEPGTASGPACDRCRSLKKKCNRSFPVCQLCTSAGRECKYSAAASNRVEVQQLRAQVEWLSEIINSNSKNTNNGSSSSTVSNTHNNNNSHNNNREIGLSSVDTVQASTRLSYVSQPRPSQGGDSLSALMDTPVVAPLATTPESDNNTGGAERGSDGVDQPQSLAVRVGEDGTALAGPGGRTPPPHVSLNPYPVMPAGPLPASAPSPALPADVAARRFVDAYFRNVNRAYPFVDRTKVLQDLDSLETFGTLWRRSPDSTLLYLIMAIGCTTLQRAGQIPEGTSAQFEIAYSDIIQECLSQATIVSLEILVLLALHSLFDPSAVPAWSIVGIVARQAVRLGVTRRSLADGPGHSAVDRELRHRLYWSIYVLDRMTSASLGLPVALTDENADVPLPGLTLQEFASPDRTTYANILQTSRHVIELRRLEDRILQQIHLRKHSEISAMTQGDRRTIIQDIRTSIEDWYSSGCLISPQEPDNLPIHSSITWLSARYYQLLVLLHYPCTLNQFGAGSVVSRMELLRLTQRHLASTSVLFQQRLLPLNRITLCRLLPIALVLMHGLLWCAAKLQPFPARDEVTLLKTILEAFPEGWTAARQAAYIVRQFLNVVTNISSYGPLHISHYPFGQSRQHSEAQAALVRPVIASLVNLMYEVLGSSTSFVFLETTAPDDSNGTIGLGRDVEFGGDIGNAGINTATTTGSVAGPGISLSNSENNEDISDLGWAGWELDFL